MRPLIRPEFKGNRPRRYGDYLQPLLTDFGRYCSYCERLEKLDVEHVVPKSIAPELELEWSNLLLGCLRCNRDFKKNHNHSRDGYIWPDQHNTFAMLHYDATGRVRTASDLTPEEQRCAQATITLLKLDDSDQPQIVLNQHRRTTFRIAQKQKQDYQNGYTSVDEICDLASLGYWSVWMTAFAEFPEVVTALILMSQYPNTRID